MIKDLVVDRGAFDRIIAAGGFISAPTGVRAGRQRHSGRRSRRRTPRWTPRRASAAARASRRARTARRCCSRPRRSRTSALLPQGQPERDARALRMVAQMDAEGFGNCTQYGECEAACPKEISIDTIARMNRDYRGRDDYPSRGAHPGREPADAPAAGLPGRIRENGQRLNIRIPECTLSEAPGCAGTTVRISCTVRR